jgi:heme-degrading monooxygenase HmoA
MIIVHDIFICKPGNAGKLAKLFKEWADLEKTRGFNMTIMTDMTGQWHRVIVVTPYESLADYEKKMGQMGDSPEHKKLMEKFKDMNEMYVSGSREIYKVW